VAFDVRRLAGLVAEDHRRNPSHYAVVVISEGARMEGGEVLESGAPDAYGHRRLGGVGQRTADALETLTGIEVISQRLAYLMRSGAPDSLDRMVAASFGHLAVEQLAGAGKGVMMAVEGGKYATVPIDSCVKGEKRVDVAALYDLETYRPRVAHVLGKSIFF
jgi:6-phosphofructokinase 1